MMKDKKRYSILIIEDNPGDCLLIEDFLLENIYLPDILHAHNFKEAKEYLINQNKSFDVILMDLTLPDKAGDELVTEMVMFLPNCPMVILTGYADIDFSIQSISRGISDYILKDDLNAAMLYKSIIYAIERKKTSQLVEDSEKRYSNLFHLSPQPMWLYDCETLQFVQVNNSALNHYGYSEDEFLAMKITEICTEEDAENLKKTIEIKELKGENSFTGSSNHLKKNGEIINVEVYSTGITINDRLCRSVIAIDVTERNLYEHKIIKAIIKTQEEERYEIGGELHDNVCQILATSMISLGMMKKYIEPTAEQWYKNTKDYITMASDEIRNLSHRLAPAFFDDSNFEVAIEILLNTFNAAEEYEITLQFDDKISQEDLSLDMQLNLYRIVQEKLRNIMKYAKATKISLDFYLENDILVLKITDNGIGFNTENAKYGIGLANMKRRTELFSGIFLIKSAPGEGCVMTVSIPTNIKKLQKS